MPRPSESRTQSLGRSRSSSAPRRANQVGGITRGRCSASCCTASGTHRLVTPERPCPSPHNAGVAASPGPAPCALIPSVFLTGMLLLTVADVVLRALVNFPIPGVYDLVELFLAATFF